MIRSNARIGLFDALPSVRTEKFTAVYGVKF